MQHECMCIELFPSSSERQPDNWEEGLWDFRQFSSDLLKSGEWHNVLEVAGCAVESDSLGQLQEGHLPPELQCLML